MIRARSGRASSRPVRLLSSIVTGVLFLAACQAGPSIGPTGTPGAVATTPPSGTPTGSAEPPATGIDSSSPTEGPGVTPTPDAPSASPGTGSAACSGSDANREFFRQADASMVWPVYCPVLPDGWFVQSGTYRLADGGRLEITYRGPGDARLSLVEGNVCAGADVDSCAPRDAVIGPAPFGDREGELGRLANGLVLDVDRGASPSWRATGLGLSEEAFRAICAALEIAEG